MYVQVYDVCGCLLLSILRTHLPVTQNLPLRDGCRNWLYGRFLKWLHGINKSSNRSMAPSHNVPSDTFNIKNPSIPCCHDTSWFSSAALIVPGKWRPKCMFPSGTRRHQKDYFFPCSCCGGSYAKGKTKTHALCMAPVQPPAFHKIPRCCCKKLQS